MPNKTPETKPEPKLSNAFERGVKISSDTLKLLFDTPTPSDKIKELIELISGRIKDVRYRNYKEGPIWAAVDAAVESPLKSITPTLLKKIMASGLKPDDIERSAKAFGISDSDCFDEVQDSENQKRRVFRNETFWKAQLPLALSILKARVAKLYTDRDSVPFLPFEPLVFTEINRLKCEMWSNIIERMSNQYGLKAKFKHALWQSGKYNIALAFFEESWHHEKRTDGNGNSVTAREGIRLRIPPPTRMGFDINHPISTLNTDTGCEWALYWRLCRWGDIEDNEMYWNRDRVSYGRCWFDPAIPSNYFKEIYPCQIALPAIANASHPGEIQNDRELAAGNYSGTDHDKAVFLTDIRMKLVPKKWGLGDYDSPLWFRFEVASDDTVVFAEPMPDCPVVFLGWDTDDSRHTQSSLVLESLPHQDTVDNLVSQHRLTTKQNLAKIVWHDIASGMSVADLKKSISESQEFAHVVFIPYDGRKFKNQGIDPKTVLTPMTFGYQDTTALITCLNTYLNLMERMLGMSSNEFGVNAPRITTAAETMAVAQNSSARNNFTGSWSDDFLDALKRRLVRFCSAFMDDQFATFVTDASQESLDKLKELGFEVGATDGRRTEIKGSKKLLDVDDFVSSRSLQNRTNHPQLAMAMYQALQSVAPFITDGSPESREQVIALFNQAAQMAGVPRDFKFVAPKPPEPQKTPPLPPPDVLEKMYKDSPEDVKRQIEMVFGLQPSQMPTEEQIQQAIQQGIMQQGQQIVQAATQQSVQAMQQPMQQIGAAIKQFQQQIGQLAQLIAQNRQDDQGVAQQLAATQGAVAQLVQEHQAMARAMQPIQSMPA